MNAPASYTNPFFITRRSANLMEDLHRQVSNAGAVCLIYGVEGVGKSRLIRQFISTRLNGSRVKFCRLSSDGFFLDDDHRLHAFENLMPSILNTTSSNYFWVIDQLEFASEDFLQQLLRFWAQHASQLSGALVLACRPERLGMVYKISEQLTLKVSCVELKRLSKTEALQYISTQFCPDMNTVAVFSREVSQAFKRAAGIPGQLDKITQRYSGIVECTQKRSDKRKVIPLFIVAVTLLAFAAAIYLNTGKLNLIDKQVDQQAGVNQLPEPAVNQPQDFVTTSIVEPVILPEDQVVTQLKEPVATEKGNAQVQKPSIISVEQPDAVNIEIEKQAKPQNLLIERLSATDKWLLHSSDKTASIQIMSLLVEEDPQKSLLRFFHKLEAKGINLDQIYVYSMSKEDNYIYVVLFGSYADRAEARVNMNSLPSSLKANGPIVRTVRGIKNEVEAGNK